MADLTHDFGAGDDAFHEIHLSGKQLVFLFMATTVVSVVIFLCGVLVGRGVPTQPPPDHLSDAAASAPVTPSPAPAPAPAPVADAGPSAAAPPAPPAETDELSYKKRLEGEAATKESLKPRPQQPPATAAAAVATPPPAAPPASQQPVVGTAQPGTWIVQVHALRDRSVASGIVQRLITKGYPAFLVAAGPPTGVYKVQVGRYKDRDEALKVIEKLKKEEQFNPWITR